MVIIFHHPPAETRGTVTILCISTATHDPAVVFDHKVWTRHGIQEFHELFPFPWSEILWNIAVEYCETTAAVFGVLAEEYQ
jgi:hypothetical protein